MNRIAFLAAALLAPAAAAQTFDEIAARARPTSPRELAGLVWAATAACEPRGDALLDRQCRGVLAARERAAREGTFLVELEAGAASRSGLRGCLACAAPLEGGLFAVTRGNLSVASGAVVGPELWRGEIPGTRDPGRLRAELVFKIPAETWTQAGLRGVAVDPVAFRLSDPCDGTVIAASPPSSTAPPLLVDRARCGAAPAAAAAPASDLPEVLSAEQVRDALRPVGDRVQVCFESFGVPGRADVAIDVAGDGHVRYAEVRGELADTPTARCILEAVKNVKFPRFRRAGMQIDYPFILR
jgi:hypothetical protein